MNKIAFSKYHGTGNDFILIDDRQENFNEQDHELIARMCSRRFGIGADGLMLLRMKDGYDFEMIYFNSDGHQSSMCGNGGRCIVHFAYSMGIIERSCSFIAIDGPHEAFVLENEGVKLKMSDITNIELDGEAFILDTGSPHYVVKVDLIESIDIKKTGSEIRYSRSYAEEGINVNFVECMPNRIKVATYERGVEDETYSCGTGVTAAAIAIFETKSNQYSSPIIIQTKGGELSVYFRKEDSNKYTDVWLQGPAVKTYDGIWNLN
ncbi:MAG: diaminopimelate epimerase [Saprospiraceae bacterium]|nr:diaminopimelate epimerase [Saprospiraceae bacterium]